MIYSLLMSMHDIASTTSTINFFFSNFQYYLENLSNLVLYNRIYNKKYDNRVYIISSPLPIEHYSFRYTQFKIKYICLHFNTHFPFPH